MMDCIFDTRCHTFQNYKLNSALHVTLSSVYNVQEAFGQKQLDKTN